MWQLDPFGTPFDDADAAREELRRRAWLAISDGLRHGSDVRHHRVRLRDENGNIIFEGTLAEAIAHDTEQIRLPPLRREEAPADASRRIIREIKINQQRTTIALSVFSNALAELNKEVQATRRLLSAVRIG